MKNIANWLIGICAYLFLSILYQKYFGEEPFNNAFAIGLPRFYFEFYNKDCIKLNGSNFMNLLINIIIYMFVFTVYIKILKKINKVS